MNAICLTHEQRRELIARYVSPPRPETSRCACSDPCATPAQHECRIRRTLGKHRGDCEHCATISTPRRQRGWKDDVVTAWLLAWPELNDQQLVDAILSETGQVVARSTVSYVRRGLGIPSAQRRLNDERRAKMRALVASGWSYTEIGEALGISRITVAGILFRAKARGE